MLYQAPESIAKKRILVVDDTPSIRALATASLRTIGFQNITELGNGLDALHYINEKPVDLVISDWDMPELNGFELLQTLRSYDELKHLPFIMFSGSDSSQHIEKAIKAGITDYMIKPFTNKSLAIKTLKALNQSQYKKVDLRAVQLKPIKEEVNNTAAV